MANKAKVNNKKKKGQRKGRKTAAPPRYNIGQSRLANHLAMVMDPCNSPIGPSAYRGKDGFMTRFSAAVSVSDVTATCCVIAFWPRYNRTFVFPIINTSFAFALDFYNTTFGAAGPGGAFMGTNVSENRPVAACVSSQYTGTELDRQGLLLQGVVPYKSVAGSSLTVDSLTQLMQAWSRTPDGPTDTKWIPSPADEDYQATPATVPTVYGDDNIVIHVYRGFTAGKLAVTARITHIQEWQPFYGLGISVPTPNTVDPPAGLERVRSALASYGDWWLHTADSAASMLRSAGNIASGAYRTARIAASAVRGGASVLGYARAVPQLLLA